MNGQAHNNIKRHVVGILGKLVSKTSTLIKDLCHAWYRVWFLIQ